MEIVRTSRHNYVKYRDCWLFKKLEFKNWKVSRNLQWLCRILLSKHLASKTYLPWKSFERVAHKNTLLPFFMGMKEKFGFFSAEIHSNLFWQNPKPWRPRPCMTSMPDRLVKSISERVRRFCWKSKCQTTGGRDQSMESTASFQTNTSCWKWGKYIDLNTSI